MPCCLLRSLLLKERARRLLLMEPEYNVVTSWVCVKMLLLLLPTCWLSVATAAGAGESGHACSRCPFHH